MTACQDVRAALKSQQKQWKLTKVNKMLVILFSMCSFSYYSGDGVIMNDSTNKIWYFFYYSETK